MKSMLVYPLGATEAIQFAAALLHKTGIPLIDHPSPEITHLLLDVPSFSSDRKLRCGVDAEKVLERLPPETVVVGGNLEQDALANYRTVDFLKDEAYLAMNAAITADCALQVAAPLLKTTFRDTPALVIGWGRIGKCLAQLLRNLGADVTVAARKEASRAPLRSLGYRAVDMDAPLSPYCLIFNTVPAEVFSREIQETKNCVKIDLASRKGLVGEDVVWARGLPGIYAPESSGRLIADTFVRLCKEV